jgi:hypothetical protein
MRYSGGFGFTSFSGSGPSGSASISGLGSVGGLAIGGNVQPGLAVAGTLRASSATGTFNGGPYANATIAGAATGATPAGTIAPAPPSVSTKATAALASLAVLVDWFPNPSDGWHVGGSVGLGIQAISIQADGSTYEGIGVAGSIFGGYDWWLGPHWSLGLAASVSGGNKPPLKDSSSKDDTGYTFAPVSVGVEASLLYF